MGFRAPLDLRGYLGGLREEAPHTAPTPPAWADPEMPYRWGFGPTSCSTSMELERVPTVIWDTNRYYRDLGFSFPFRPTKRQLREAYTECNGSDSVRKTYCFKQLLNPVTRAEYDRVPFGDMYLDDYLQAYFKRLAVHRAAQRRQNGEEVSAKDVLEEWGLTHEPEDDEPDPEPTTEEEPSDDGEPLEWDLPEIPSWEWAYYLWRSDCTDVYRLAEWQHLLIRAFASYHSRMTVAVGFMGGQPETWLPVKIGRNFVAFLNEDVEPSESLALDVVRHALDNKLITPAQKDLIPR